MQKYLYLLLLLSIGLSASAQTTEEEANDDLAYSSTRRDNDIRIDRPWWFGTGAQLQFSSFNNTNFFLIGLSPMAGYHINNFLSVGPRGAVAYNRFRDDQGGRDQTLSFITWSAGAFARAKIFRGIFAHAEYSLVNEALSTDLAGNINRTTRAIPFLGAGLNQGGGPGSAGFEILLLFRLSQPETISDSPYEFRTGINWNF